MRYRAGGVVGKEEGEMCYAAHRLCTGASMSLQCIRVCTERRSESVCRASKLLPSRVAAS